MWDSMMGHGLTKLHMLLAGQTLTSEYYINQILEKEMKPLTSRHQVTGGPIERNLLSSKKEMTFVEDGALQRQLRHGVKELFKLYSQGWLASELS